VSRQSPSTAPLDPPTPPPTSVDFDTGQLVLRGDYRDGGDPTRQVLLLHGGGQTRHSWGRTADGLAAAGWTATTLDLRGHGDSDWDREGRYGLTEHVADLQAVVARLGGGLVLVGASLGGLTALRLAGSAPAGTVRALVLVDIVPRTNPAGARRISDFMTGHPDGFADLHEAADVVAAYTRRPRRTDVSGLRKNLRLRADGRWHWHWDPAMTAGRPTQEPPPGIDPEAVLATARRVQVPVLVVRGALSDVVDDAGVQEFVDAVPRAEVVTVAGAGHMVAGDDNDPFTTAVLAFLHRLRD
jgi:pimeloyl-ACP methyl ester carboxylesterase